MRQYVSCWDRNYMAKGVALYRSLLRHHSEPFMFRVLVIDDSVEELADLVSRPISGEKLTGEYARQRSIGMFPLAMVVDSELESARANRTYQETCWTLASWWTRHIMRAEYVEPGETLTYLDADTFFFSDPKVIHEEIGSASIAILPHHFAPQHEARLLPNGKYCVSWVTFRNDETGNQVLDDWTKAVLSRCRNETRDGGIGDQGYLNDWPTRYPNVHVIGNRGLSLAPWNQETYLFGNYGTGLFGDRVLAAGWERFSIVAYHCHEFQRRGKGDYRLTGYPVSETVRRLIYDPYIAEIERVEEERG